MRKESVMEQKPFFSIVMPVYGVEPYLRRALDSVVGQTFRDFEVILVNDASPDGSAGICDEYCQAYDCIRTVTHPENRGLSAARNTGLSCARGEYIWFMDSDDHVDPNLLQTVYDSLQKNPAQLVVFGCVEEYYNRSGQLEKTVTFLPEEAYCATREQVRSRILDLETQTLYGYAWNKFYHLPYLCQLGLQYENIVLIEDIKFNIAFCDSISSMNLLPIAPYHYAKRGSGSLTAKFVPDYYAVHAQRVALLLQQQEAWGMADDRARSILANILTRYIFSALSRNCDRRAKMTHGDRKRWLKEVYGSELFARLIPHAHARGLALKVMTGILKGKQVTAALCLGRVIYLVQTHLRSVFTKIRQARS